jgi:hypothetical protein
VKGLIIKEPFEDGDPFYFVMPALVADIHDFLWNKDVDCRHRRAKRRRPRIGVHA